MRPSSKPGGDPARRRCSAGDLEQLAHLVGADQPVELAADACRRGRAARAARASARCARCPAGAGTRPGSGWRVAAPSARAAASTAGKSAWTVRSASPGQCQGIDLLVAPAAPAGCRRSPARRGRSRSAAPRRRRAAIRRAELGARSAAWAGGLLDRPAPAAASGSRPRGRACGAGRRPASPSASSPTTCSAQPIGGAHELAGGQAVEQFVGDQDQRRVGRQPRPGSRPSAARVAPARSRCRRAQRRARSRPARGRRRRGSPARAGRRAGRRPSASRRRAPPRPAATASGRAQSAPRLDAPTRPISSPNIWQTRGAVMKSPSSPSAGRVA